MTEPCCSGPCLASEGCTEYLEDVAHCCDTGTCAHHTPEAYRELAEREPDREGYHESLLESVRSWAEQNEVTL